VLCHGLAAGSLQFAADAERLAATGRCVLVPDLRGHGLSRGSIEPSPENFRIELMAQDMLRMLDHAKVGPVDWVGNSLGGILALAAADMMPSAFRTLALFGTAPALNLPKGISPVFPVAYRVLGKRLVASLMARSTTPNRAGRVIVNRMIQDFDPAVGAALTETLRRYDLTDAALRLEWPTLIVRCSADRAVNLALDRALPRLLGNKNITRIDLAGAGHCANLDQPDALYSALTAFWSKH